MKFVRVVSLQFCADLTQVRMSCFSIAQSNDGLLGGVIKGGGQKEGYFLMKIVDLLEYVHIKGRWTHHHSLKTPSLTLT